MEKSKTIRKEHQKLSLLQININKARINYPSEKHDSKKFEEINQTIALIYPAYVSKQKSNREKQIIFLMMPDGERIIIWIIQAWANCVPDADQACLGAQNLWDTHIAL